MATKNISLGSTNNIGLALGSTIISKAYLGDVLVYDASVVVNPNNDIHNPGDIDYELFEDLLN